jgi:hypothetical protein
MESLKMLTLLLRFLPSLTPFAGILVNPWFWLAVAGYTIALAGFAAFQGHAVGVAKLHAHLADDARAEVRFVRQTVQLAGEVRTVYIQGETKVVDHFHIIEREAQNVPVRAACNVTAGWLRVHDAAADGPGGRIVGAVDDATDSGVTEAESLDVVVGNYRSFYQVANDLRACRAFVDGLTKIK